MKIIFHPLLLLIIATDSMMNVQIYFEWVFDLSLLGVMKKRKNFYTLNKVLMVNVYLSLIAFKLQSLVI